MGLPKAEAVKRAGKQRHSSWTPPQGEGVKASWIGRGLHGLTTKALPVQLGRGAGGRGQDRYEVQCSLR